MKESSQKRVKSLEDKYGKDWWSEMGRRPHKARGEAFRDPEVRAKAIETRRVNRLQRQIIKEGQDELQDIYDQ